jgi:hypothetical protein
MRLTNRLFIILFFLSVCSCESVEVNEVTPVENEKITPAPKVNLGIPDNRFSNNYQVLIFGNSHVSGLNNLIETLIRSGNPFATINVTNEGGGFLDNNQQIKVDLIKSKPWTHVILQGQKYSQSGTTSYSTVAAQVLIDKAKTYQITPILFPEHPRRGNTEEGKRVHDIHMGIADLQKSCVAPIGLTWDKVILTNPQLALHSSDGNHASLLGKLLTAYVFYEVITGESADSLPFIEEITITESTQQFLRQFASETVQAYQPCIFD